MKKYNYLLFLQAISKNGLWFKIPALERRGRHGGHEFQTGGILLYFEDLKFMSNTDIGPKDFFEMACSSGIYHYSTQYSSKSP